ncbi:MAG: hypothetical protein H7844_00920 [Nitrospirae bacterium YQR-1]
MSAVSKNVKIKSPVLQWVGENTGLLKDVVASKIKKSASIVKAREGGYSMPALAQRWTL